MTFSTREKSWKFSTFSTHVIAEQFLEDFIHFVYFSNFQFCEILIWYWFHRLPVCKKSNSLLVGCDFFWFSFGCPSSTLSTHILWTLNIFDLSFLLILYIYLLFILYFWFGFYIDLFHFLNIFLSFKGVRQLLCSTLYVLNGGFAFCPA